ncbi:MAG TPA: hypothetical protein VII13_15250 [Vicinamibacteria bacterium]
MRALGPLAAALVAAAACAAEVPSPMEASAAAGSVLFVGNSLTAANELHHRYEEVSAAAGRRVPAAAVTSGGFSLLDHWNDGRALRAIRRGGWSLVVLQQGPSTLSASREELTRMAQRFGEEIRRAGARPALLMAWPLPGQTFEAVSASYRAAAAATGSLLIPAGDAFAAALRREAGLPLFAADRFHPAPLGSYLAAMAVQCAREPGARPVLPPQAESLGVRLTSSQQQLLGEAACPDASPARGMH